LSAARPRAGRRCYHHEPIVKKDFSGEIIIQRRMHNSADHEIDLALAQFPKAHGGGLYWENLEGDFRVTSGHAVEDGGYKSGCEILRAADANFSDAWICQKLDLPHALAEFIEYDAPAPEQRICVTCRLDTARTSIEQAHAQGGLQIRNGF
jgi:hypothetical protein